MNMTLQDMLAMLAFTLSSTVTLIGFMWHHFNNSFEKIENRIDNRFKEIDNRFKEFKHSIDSSFEKIERRIDNTDNKIDILNINAVRERVSRLEGQLAPATIVSFEERISKGSAFAQ
jgi:hypothetical protein